MTPSEIAKRLIEEYDPEHPSDEIYADELVSWHNYDEKEIKLTRDQLAVGAKGEHGALGSVLTGFGYEPLPTLMIGQLSLIELERSVSPHFFSSWPICVSLLIRTGVAVDFQVSIVSFQTGE